MITLVPLSIALKELHFTAGLPGFPAARHFDSVRWGGPESPFVVLTGHEPMKIQFVLVATESYFPDYRPEFSAEYLAAVGLDRAEDAVVLVIVTLGGQPGEDRQPAGPPADQPRDRCDRPGGAARRQLGHPGGAGVDESALKRRELTSAGGARYLTISRSPAA